MIISLALTMKLTNFCLFLINFGVTFGLRVDLEVGSLRGRIEKAKPSGANYASFTAIPYAEPPTQKLRFKEPLKKSPWTGVFDATSQKIPICAQLGKNPLTLLQDPEQVVGTEDCLVLNVYTPLKDGKSFK